MRAVVLRGPRAVEVVDVHEPRCEQPDDAVVRVTTSGICGSDVHAFTGRSSEPPGFVLGHEAVGTVEEVGARVATLRAGDRVAMLLSVACGRCARCRSGEPRRCPEARGFGFGELPGTQADYVRVPHADGTCRKLDENVSDAQAIFLSDGLCTAYYCLERADVRVGDTVAVVGCGPVGLLTVLLARRFGVARVLAFDRVPARLAAAESLGAEPARVDGTTAAESFGGDVDAVCETAGSPSAFALALALVRPEGTVSSVGAYPEASLPFPIGEAFRKGLTLRTGICPVHNYVDRALELIRTGAIDPAPLVTHVFRLDDAPRAYEVFAEREGGVLKAVLVP